MFGNWFNILKALSKKDIKIITQEIESVGVIVLDIQYGKHLKFTMQNPNTDTIRTIPVSISPKVKNLKKYPRVKSQVKRVFRDAGEIL